MRNLMVGLARSMLRMLGRDERGAIGVLVAVLLGGGVLLGMGALAIDVGQLYQERAELQNGADSGALGVAKSCVDGLSTCTLGGATSIALSYASLNASQLTGHSAGLSQQICGRGIPGAPLCGPSNGAMTDCPSPPASGNYVDVHTSTLLPNNSTLLPPVFARTLGFGGTNVKACAQAEWGSAIQADSLAFTISLCEWNQFTGGNPYGTEIAVVEHGNADTCTGPSGQQLAGGFGWLAGTNCTATLNFSNPPLVTGESKPGTSLPPGCAAAIQNDLNTVVFLPVFNGFTSGNKGGNNGTFNLIGLAAFYLNGWINMPSGLSDHYPPQYPSKKTAQAFCAAAASGGSGKGSNERCLFGYFTHGLVPVTNDVGPPGTNYFGAGAVRLSG